VSPGRHRRRGLSRSTIAAAAAVAVLLVLVVTAVVHQRDSAGPEVTPPAPPAGPDATPIPPSTAGHDQMPRWMEDADWVQVCGLELPVSARYGPYERDGVRMRGFARTPDGAVLAMLHLVVQTSPQTGPQVFTAAVAEQVTGPDAATFGHEIHGQYEHARQVAQEPYGQALCPIYATVRGYRLDSFHDDAASLRLLIEAPGPQGLPQLASVLVQVAWVDDDWHLVAPPHGDWSRVRTLLPPSAAGPYTPLTGGR
jgi:hypothetical protein